MAALTDSPTGVPPSAAPASTGRAATGRRRSVVVTVARVLLVLVFVLPLLFMFVSSLKPDLQIFDDLTNWRAFVPVGDISFENYAGVFDRVPFLRFLVYSIGISTITVVLGIFINSLAAFGLSRLQWRGQQLVLTADLGTLNRAVGARRPPAL